MTSILIKIVLIIILAIIMQPYGRQVQGQWNLMRTWLSAFFLMCLINFTYFARHWFSLYYWTSQMFLIRLLLWLYSLWLCYKGECLLCCLFNECLWSKYSFWWCSGVHHFLTLHATKAQTQKTLYPPWIDGLQYHSKKRPQFASQHPHHICSLGTDKDTPGRNWSENSSDDRQGREKRRNREGGTEVKHPAALTVEDAWWRVLGDHGAVLLIAVVPTVIQLVADQRAQTQTIPIGAVELALCTAGGREGWRDKLKERETFLSTTISNVQLCE